MSFRFQKVSTGRFKDVDPNDIYWFVIDCPACSRRTYGAEIEPTRGSRLPTTCPNCGSRRVSVTLASRDHAMRCLNCKRLSWVPPDLITDFECLDCKEGDKFVACR